MKRWVIGVALLAVGACTMKGQDAPPLTGPSGFGTDLVVSISPDVLTQDGASQAHVTIAARNGQGGPIPNLSLRMDTYVANVPVDYGTLSARNVVTGADGRATLTYTAPPAPAGATIVGTEVYIMASPIGNNAANQQSQGAMLRLVPPGIIGPPIGGITAEFSMTPATPTETQVVAFDASASQAQNATIVSYHWNFGNGAQATGRLASHLFSSPGSYTVTLTVTDNIGRVASTSRTLTVSAIAAPTVGAIIASPANPAVGAQVNFSISTVTPGPGRTIVSYAWSFGDGNVASGPTATHVYSSSGIYTVLLRVTDDLGRVGSATTTVTVP